MPAYAEVHCKSNHSFLEGASHPEELVEQAAKLGLAALALTDRNTLGGMVRAHVAAKETGLRLIVGAEIAPEDGPAVLVYPRDRAGYGRLCRLLTLGRRRAEKGTCRLTWDDLAEHAAGLTAALPLLQPEFGSPEASPRAVRPVAAPWLARLREIFGERAFGLVARHFGPRDEAYLAECLHRAAAAGLPAAAANAVLFHEAGRKPLHDVLTAIRHLAAIAEIPEHLLPNAERRLKSAAEMAALFPGRPELLENALHLTADCRFSPDELRYEYPEELAPPGKTPLEYLTELTWAGARGRYPAGIPANVRDLLERELVLIAELRYEAYFLTVWDLVRFARSRDILCQGRGSAANSAVCYCLGVTAVDPARIDVLFERFVSRERAEAPDIDVDFEHERREEVLQYIYAKYGRERAGMTAVTTSWRGRSALRDAGKALGIAGERVDVLAKLIGRGVASEDVLADRCREAGLDPDRPRVRQLLETARLLQGFPRHLSQHTGGMVITRGPLCELVPIENAAMEDRTVVQWNKDDLDALGILKVDVLALGMLTCIRKAFGLIERFYGRPLTTATVPAEDPAVYRMIRRADTMGVFQIESRAQMSMLPRLRPARFYDLVIEVAIVRPGPIQGNMVHPYLRRRNGEEAVEYPNDEIRAVLEKTLGVPLFQEQAMRLAVVAAGFTPDEADRLRRAMAAWRRPGVIEQFRTKLLDGMRSRGLSATFAEQVFRQIKGFGEYGFPESHAASFALLVYVSAWLKCRYPTAFTAALLNSLPMGFYAPAQLIRNLREHGGEVRPIDVNFSAWDCLPEPPQGETASAATHAPDGPGREGGAERDLPLRLGFRLLRGVPRGAIESLEAARRRGPFVSWENFLRRTRLTRPTLIRLARADIFRSLGLDRRAALWRTLAGPPAGEAAACPLFAHLEDAEVVPPLPPASPLEQLAADYATAGFSLKGHPLELLRDRCRRERYLAAGDLRTTASGRLVGVAGLVLMRQRPSTAKGITFVTLEDETGIANLIIRPEVWERYRKAARLATLMGVRGRLERHGEVIHVLVRTVTDLSGWFAEPRPASRDFR